MWHFPALHYCVGHDCRACGNHWVSGSLKGLCVCHLHVSIVLLCSAYREFSCSLLFQGSPALSPPLYHIFYIVFYIGSPLFFQFNVTGAGARVGAGFFFFFWWAGLMAGLQVGRALGCSGCLGLGSAVPAPPPPPHIPGYPTSICDEGVKCS